MSNQEPSTSKKKSKENMEEIRDVEEEKKIKGDSEHEIGNEMEVEIKSFVDELPPEMLMKILNYLNVISLANCRLVSRKWNGIAREIIQSRDNVEIMFHCQKAVDGTLAIEGGSPRASLKNFIECFEDSKESPLYTCFQFYEIEPSVFDHVDWRKFISCFGQNIKCLKLEAAVYESVDDAIEWAEELRILLVNQLPSLQEFGFYFSYSDTDCDPASKIIQLFPKTTTITTVELPHLKVLYLDDSVISNLTGIATDLLQASVNLQKIEPFAQDCCASFESFSLLESMGKLDCLQAALIALDADLLSELKENPSLPLGFKLKSLSLFISTSVYNTRDFWSEAAVFISHLFESSKDTLRDVEMMPIGFLPGVQLPKFSKLTKLCMSKEAVEIDEGKNEVLPSGLDLNQVFPLLHHIDLKMPWTDFSPHDESEHQIVSNFPNVRTLVIKDDDGMTDEEDINRISHECPNLKELKIKNLQFGGELDNFSEVATAIWTHLTKLESLDIKILINSPTDAFPALDSCFTGFSGEYVIRLYDLVQSDKLLKESGSGNQMEISKSELEAERKSPSILDLKDLKNLVVRLRTYIPKKEIDPDLSRKVLTVSEKYAFHVTYKIDSKF